MDFTPIYLTLSLALITTFILFVISIPISHWLAFSKFRGKILLEVIVSLPLVLPPSVLGFYLLLSFSPSSWLGSFLSQTIGLKLAFSFEGLVVASMVYSFPFMVNPLKAGYRSVSKPLKEASATLGKNKWKTLWYVILPNMKSSVFIGLIMTIAHTIGEFGVVLMIGGSIPNETKVVSIAIYEEVEALNYRSAHIYSAILLIISFLILLAAHVINKRFDNATIWK